MQFKLFENPEVPFINLKHITYNANTKQKFSERKFLTADMPASVAQLDALSDWRPGGRGFNPR